MNKLSFRSLLSTVFMLCLCLMARGQTPITINGPATVCKGSTHIYDVTPPSPNVIYQWVVNTNGNISITNNNTATILWGLDGMGQIEVYGVDTTIWDTVEYGITPITVLPLPVPYVNSDVRVACLPLYPPSEDNPDPQSNDTGCIKVCAYSTVTYTATDPGGSTFDWVISGGTPTSYTATNPITVTWGAPGLGTITVIETNANGCVGTRTICYEIIESPIAHFVALPDTTLRTINICDSTWVYFIDKSTASSSSPIVSWKWDFGDGTYSSAPGSMSSPIAHMFPGPGNYTVTLTVTNSCGCGTTETMEVHVDPHEGVKITCVGVVCEGATMTYSNDQPCLATGWTVIGGTGAASSSSINVNWGAPADGYGYLIYDPAPCIATCPQPAVARVPIVLNKGNIEGETILCPNTQYIYRLPQWPSTQFNWSVSPGGMGTLHLSDQPNEIIFETGSTAGTANIHCNYTNTLLGCHGSADLSVNILEPEVIVGPDKVCIETSGSYYLQNGNNGDWTLYDATMAPIDAVSGSSTYNTPPLVTPGTYTLMVNGPGFCPPDPFAIKVDPKLTKPDSISGPDTICKGVPTLYLGKEPMYNSIFAWHVINGTVNAASGNNESYVTINGNGPFTILLWREGKDAPHCKSDTITKNIDTLVVNPILSGDPTPCRNSSSVYNNSYPDAELYEWSIIEFPGGGTSIGSIQAGMNSPSISILFNDNGGQGWVICKTRKCLVTYIDSFWVEVDPPFPTPLPTLTGGTFCVNSVATATLSAPGWWTGAVYDFDDGTEPAGGGLSKTHVYTQRNTTATVYNISATFSNPSGCPGFYVANSTMTINPAPFPVLTSGSYVSYACSTISVPLVVGGHTSYPAPVNATWEWYHNSIPGASTPIATATNSHTLTAFGWYLIRVQDVNGCWGVSDTIWVKSNCGGGTPTPVYYPCDTKFNLSLDCNSPNRQVTITYAGIEPNPLTSLQYWNPGTSSWGGTSSFSLAIGTTHTLGVKVTGSNAACSTTFSYTVPNLPVADFNFWRPITCIVDAAVEFANTSTDASNAYWQFGDGANFDGWDTKRVYGSMPTGGGNTYPVTLTVSDAFGCQDVETKDVTVIREQLDGATLSSPPFPCEGTPVTLTYSAGPGFFLGNNYEWKEGQEMKVFASTSTPTTTVFDPGYYWAYTSDQYGCWDEADPVVVDVVQVPDPAVYGDPEQCTDVEFSLSGYAGSNVTYQWYENGNPFATTPTITRKHSTSGSYVYVVEVSVPNPGSGGVCSKTSAPFTVTVHPPPATPTTINFSMVDCNDYTVMLDAQPNLPGTYNWSSGASGNPVNVSYGGWHQVTYIDQYGCENKYKQYIPKDPKVYLWIFPSGCYSICAGQSYHIVGPIIPFNNWEYRHNTWGVMASGGGYVAPFNASLFGAYTLYLDNGYCQAESDPMHLSLYGCGEGEGKQALSSMFLSADGAAMSLVPNPAMQTTTVQYHFADNGKPHYIEVFDMSGRRLYSRQMGKASGSHTLNLSEYAPGMYQVILREAGRNLMHTTLSVVK